jgi:hypothetical protein
MEGLLNMYFRLHFLWECLGMCIGVAQSLTARSTPELRALSDEKV